MPLGNVLGTSSTWGAIPEPRESSVWSGAGQLSGGWAHDISSGGDSEALQAAQMAAGAPIYSDVWNWAHGRASQVYEHVFDWVSGNISAAPLSVFSAFASTAPYAISGAKFEVPTGLDPDVLALLSGSKWNSSVVTYSFPDSRSDYPWIDPSADGYKPLDLNTEQAVRYVLEGYSPYQGGPKMGLTSVEGITNLSVGFAGRNDATLQVAGFNPNNVINRSHAYYPGVPVYSGDVWLDSASEGPGSYSYMLVLHELGHSLGLKHPHESGGLLPRMSSAHDSPEFTVMSYGHFVGNYPQTYMQYDVAALQAMYGADFTSNSDNTVYKWSPLSGEAFVNGIGQGVPLRNMIFQTIWDGGGTDTYDLSNYNNGTTIDLTPGGFVSFSVLQLAHKDAFTYVNGNVYNAFQYHNDSRSLIENAVGGAGRDNILGNAANNTLTGNAGDDTLVGAGGNDTLLGGNGADHLRGGAGADYLDGGAGDYDTIEYSDANGGVSVNLETNVVSGDIASGDRISGFENVIGGNGSDVIYGSSRDNVLFGSRGGDQLVGSGGHDYLSGDDGADMLIVNEGGSATMMGGAGDDRFVVFPGTRAKILDFTAGPGQVDEIMMYKNVFTTYAEVRAAATENANSVYITKGDFSIEIVGVKLANLHADDFIFMNV